MDVKMLDQWSKAVGTGSSLEFETILIQFWGIQPWNVPDGFLNWTSNTELWSSWSPGMMGKVSGFDGMAAEEGEKGVNPFPWHHGCTVRMWRPGLPGSVKFPFNLGQDQLAPPKMMELHLPTPKYLQVPISTDPRAFLDIQHWNSCCIHRGDGRMNFGVIEIPKPLKQGQSPASCLFSLFSSKSGTEFPL